MDCSLPRSSVHGIFQARILELVAISFSRRSSQSRYWTWVSWVSCIGGRVLYQLSHQGTPVCVCVHMCVCACVYTCNRLPIILFICTYIYIQLYRHGFAKTKIFPTFKSELKASFLQGTLKSVSSTPLFSVFTSKYSSLLIISFSTWHDILASQAPLICKYFKWRWTCLKVSM